MLCKTPIPVYEPSANELRRLWEGDAEHRPLPPIDNKREGLAYKASFGRRGVKPNDDRP